MNNSNNEKTHNVELTFDMKTGKTIGQSFPGEQDPLIKRINQDITEIIKNTFSNIGNNWILEFQTLINNKEFVKACEYLFQNESMLNFCNDKTAINSILLMDLNVLTKNQKFEYLKIAIILGGKLKSNLLLDGYIDILLSEYLAELDNNFIEALRLEKANNAARQKNNNLAYILYNDLLKTETLSDEAKGWAYRGLSLISMTKEDFESNTLQSLEWFLSSGNKHEAISNLISLSDSNYSIDPAKTIQYINEALELINPDTGFKKEILGSLYFKLAQTQFDMGEFEKSNKAINDSIIYRKDLTGNKEELHSTYSLALAIETQLGNTNKIAQIELELEKIAQEIQDFQFKLRIEILNSLKEKQYIDQKLFEKVKEFANNDVIATFYILMALDKTLDFEKKFDFLDLAYKKLSEINDKSKILSLYHFAAAETYEQYGDKKQAVEHLRKGLDLDPYRLVSIKKYLNFLQEDDQWPELVEFISLKQKIYESSNYLLYLKAYGLFKLTKYNESLKILQEIPNDINIQDKTEKLIVECVQKGAIPVYQLNPPTSQVISLFQIKEALMKIAENISSSSRMSFWKTDSDGKISSWVNSPENFGKQLLIQSLQAYFYNANFEILDEIRIDAGRIDLYIISGNFRFIIELKMCGHHYSSTYAISGEDQLLHYMKGKNLYTSFLFVFDGRKIEQGKYFTETNSIENFTIYNIICNLNPNIK
ncbi:hypothetical protein NUH30_19540 [Leptospira sp. 85282-16]|uniref:tetratricopeptide repeat protein n=1 Tax=Leptospira sp. 85282-16 TaxID=2971256 RepID=UPI0021C0DBC7|nr:hypothetical protein [Leptospira sp. 85282-16]MCT8335890.1 hypothetical protein [Leptospira sp. 85282-16]